MGVISGIVDDGCSLKDLPNNGKRANRLPMKLLKYALTLARRSEIKLEPRFRKLPVEQQTGVR